MKKCLSVLALGAALLWACGESFSATNFASKSPISQSLEAPKAKLWVGEFLVFDVFWMGIQVGTGTLEVREQVHKDGHLSYHVIARAKTNDFLSKIYPIEDEAHSFIDATSFHSLEFQKDLKEGRYRSHEKVVYDYSQKKSFHESLLNGSKKEYDIEGPTHDFLSAFYWFRVQNPKVGTSLWTLLHNKGKNYDLELKILRREIKELRGGQTQDTIVVEPVTRLKEVLYDRGRAWVYFSADAKRTPVWITISTPFGPVVGVLRRSD